MKKDEIKRMVLTAIEANGERIKALGDELLHSPETAFKETKSSAIIKRELTDLGLSCRESLAITGLRSDLRSGREGPTVAVMGELDAIRLPSHPFADKITGAAHACGHHAQGTAMIGAAIGLTASGVIDQLAGNIAFIAVPAEEAQPTAYYKDFLQKKLIRATSGKAQLILEGVFDDVDIAMLSHLSTEHGIPAGYNGLQPREFTFHGKAAHAGLAPENGVNALSMLRCAMSMIDAQRENQNPADYIRIHGVITEGGLAENIIPDKAVLSLLIRAKSLDALEKALAMTERCAKGAALAFGGKVDITGNPGYLPMIQSETLADIHRKNLAAIEPEISLIEIPYRGSSTDMGDISSILPAFHPHNAGAEGTPHENSFIIKDPEAAYVTSAKLLAMNIIDLLYGNAEVGCSLAREKTVLTREEYHQRWDGEVS